MNKLILLLTFSILFLVPAGAQNAFAAHFVFGHLNWETTGNPNEVEFDGKMAFTATSLGGNPAIGSIQCDNHLVRTLEPGGFQTLACLKVESVNVSEDWVLGSIVDSAGNPITHTYPDTSGPFVAEFYGCCTVSTIREGNNDRTHHIITQVDPTNPNHSPVSNMLPVVTCAKDAVCVFPVPATDSDGDSLTFSQSPLGTTYGIGSGLVTATSYSIDANTGIITWDTTGKPTGLYGTSVKIEESSGGPSFGFGMVEFIINIVDDTTPPIAVCQNAVVPLSASGQAEISVSDIDGGSSDDVGLAGLTLSPRIFSCSELGANTVTLTVTDTVGNTSFCTATVTIEDPQNACSAPPPEIIGGEIIPIQSTSLILAGAQSFS